MIIEWDDLPDSIKNEYVKKYYEILKRGKKFANKTSFRYHSVLIINDYTTSDFYYNRYPY